MAGKDPGIEQADAMAVFDQVQAKNKKIRVAPHFGRLGKVEALRGFCGVLQTRRPSSR